MPTQTESLLPIYSSLPADLSAVTCTTVSVQYTVGFSNGPGSSTLSAASVVGATTVVTTSATSFYQGEAILLTGGKTNAELCIITNIASTTFTVQRFDGGPLIYAHASGDTIVGTSAAMMPIANGRMKVHAEGTLTGNATGDVMQAQLAVIAVNTGSQTGPAAGTALSAATGLTAIGNKPSYTELTGVLTQGFSVTAELGVAGSTNTTPASGAILTPGTPYVFDLLVADTGTGGKTVQAKSVIWTIEEE